MAKWLIVTHDAGGAEVISSWLRVPYAKNPDFFEFVIEGPAIEIFRRKLGDLKIHGQIRSQMYGREALNAITADFVLTGTGWASDLERQAIRAARSQGIKVASYLDHWNNYRTRFDTKPELILPDEIWVGDSYALEIAEKTFPGTTIKFEANLHFEEMAREINEKRNPRPRDDDMPRILFVAEPLSAPREYGGKTDTNPLSDEFIVLRDYLENLRSTGVHPEMIRVRPHPSEPPGKYDGTIAPFRESFLIESSRGRTLVEDCAWADWVVGCDTMAMVIGLIAGRKVFSCLPRGGSKLTLPYPGIIKIFQN